MSTFSLQPVSTPARAAPGQVRPRLGEVLCAAGIADRASVQRGLDAQRHMSARLGDLLCADGALSPQQILLGLMRQFGAGTVDLVRDPPDPDLVVALGLETCLTHRMLPWRRAGSVTVVAAVYPDRFEAMRPELEAAFGEVRLVVVLAEDMRRCLDRLLPRMLRDRAESRVSTGLSCRSWTGRRFRRAVLAGSAGLAASVALAPAALMLVLTAASVLLLVLMTAMKLLAGIAALRRDTGVMADRPSPDVIHIDAGRARRLPVVSLLVPLYREQEIARTLVARLGALRYPPALLDICLVTEQDDRITRATLGRTRLPATMRVVTVPPGAIRTKPRAMNYALDFCRGDLVGVYDAEDAPEPDQIDRVVERFAQAAPDVACLQGRLSFYNTRQNALSRCFAIEYATWFSVVLPGVARLGVPVPLGGTTLFFRRDVLEALGGWDAHNVTEDADLGVRLARAGYRTELIDTVTREEANCLAWPWIRQRSRWIKGYAMTYATHMRRPGRMLRDLGPRGFAGFQILFAGTLLQALLAPLLWLWWLVPLGMAHPLSGVLPGPAILAICGVLLCSEAVNLGLALLALRRTGQKGLSLWVLAMNPYHMLATFAAIKAVVEMLNSPFFWDKTRHGLSTPEGTG